MSKAILKALPELIDAGILTSETASKVEAYYKNKSTSADNRIFTIFGIFGALLVALGIILILAHNWDNFPRSVKTIFAFLPLLIGQSAAGFTLLKKSESTAWREASATFLFFAIAAAISLVSQIYNIPGNISSFLVTWMLLSLPLIYLLRSSMVSLLYLCGITYYGCEVGYWMRDAEFPGFYWIMLALALPFYLWRIRNKVSDNFMSFHNWFIPLSLIICMGTIYGNREILLLMTYFSLFSVLYLIGTMPYFERQRRFNNGYLLLGSVGMVMLLLYLSFDFYWNQGFEQLGELMQTATLSSSEFLVTLLLTLVSGGILFWKKGNKILDDFNPMEILLFIMILVFIAGINAPILGVILINILTLLIGIYYIRKGGQLDHLIILNYGLLIITALIICRFFDTDLSFVLRGLLFVGVGLGFFYANYSMLKKRKAS